MSPKTKADHDVDCLFEREQQIKIESQVDDKMCSVTKVYWTSVIYNNGILRWNIPNNHIDLYYVAAVPGCYW